jgi:hypothetical protein
MKYNIWMYSVFVSTCQNNRQIGVNEKQNTLQHWKKATDQPMHLPEEYIVSPFAWRQMWYNEAMVTTYKITWCHNPKDHSLIFTALITLTLIPHCSR